MTQMNLEQARFNMIEQQIRPWEVLDQRVLDVMGQTPREAFVPERYRQVAYADVRIPLGHGQAMMNPNIEGRLLQALQVRPGERVLEVGTGSGYLACLLARLGGMVTSVDLIGEFTEAARLRLQALGIDTVQLRTGDAADGWGEARFDAIALTGSVPALSEAWRQALNIGGRLFAVIGDAPTMEAVLVTRLGENEWRTDSLFETELARLSHTATPNRFAF